MHIGLTQVTDCHITEHQWNFLSKDTRTHPSCNYNLLSLTCTLNPYVASRIKVCVT